MVLEHVCIHGDVSVNRIFAWFKNAVQSLKRLGICEVVRKRKSYMEVTGCTWKKIKGLRSSTRVEAD